MSLKNPVTPLGINPWTVRLVAQHLNHYATPGPALLTCSWWCSTVSTLTVHGFSEEGVFCCGHCQQMWHQNYRVCYATCHVCFLITCNWFLHIQNKSKSTGKQPPLPRVMTKTSCIVLGTLWWDLVHTLQLYLSYRKAHQCRNVTRFQASAMV